ncbi:MAG TPA: bifunctional diaminohydroxyphosphoribosylaminopyrimidine deaminase/5-amino-6-(5-phosphoribosylamino)uracil reductase RibD [Gemmatales bacterium]|nr:bifunctional diaminohydroxyphosphoribosylaminopyrimidine deaminase/5-amino-6-(5-phosphoribosylamino)uracil reductase RibD [Gemmatales bacterium]
MMSFDLDHNMMARALELAGRGQGRVEPNPMVGAVVVREGKIIGEGYHQVYGGPHAEVLALQQAGELARGATLYVTLEPCCHHGKTPPCTDAIIKAGIKEVVAADSDPFPQVTGGGFSALASAGIQVRIGVLRQEAEQLNTPYNKLVRTGLPYVIAKWAMTLDGKIATATGESKWISGEESRRLVHELRGRMDGILVGIGTVLTDDPLLTARPAGPRVATRIVLDTHLKIPMTSQLVKTAGQAPVLLVHGSINDKRVAELSGGSCECLRIDAVGRTESIQQLLKELGKRRMTSLLVEGGAAVLGSFFDAQAVDEVWAFIAPKWIGNSSAKGPLSGIGVKSISQISQLEDVRCEQVGKDVLLRGRCVRSPQGKS